MKMTIAILCAAFLVCSCGQRDLSQHDKLLAECQRLLLEECTNQTVGITKILKADIYELPDQNPTNWMISEIYTNDDSTTSTDYWAFSGSAEATVEYINKVGGIERKEIPFVFCWNTWPPSSKTNLFCLPDYKKIGDEGLREFREQLNSIGK